MRSLEEVLRQKEFEAEKLRDEIRTLRAAARILETPDGAAPTVAATPEVSKAWP